MFLKEKLTWFLLLKICHNYKYKLQKNQGRLVKYYSFGNLPWTRLGSWHTMTLWHIISTDHISILCILGFDSNYSVMGDGKEDKLIKTIKGIRTSPVFKISYVSDVTLSPLTLCGLFDDRSSLEQCKDFNIRRWASLARINPPGLYKF